jgi:hypothetical protein
MMDGAGCSADRRGLVAERGVSSAVVVLHGQPPALPARRAAPQRPVAFQPSSCSPPYISVQAIRDLAGGEHPGPRWVGIGLAISSIVLTPSLGIAKQCIGQRMGSVATQGEGAQNPRLRPHDRRGPRRPGRQRALRPVAARPDRRAGDRRTRRAPRHRGLARRELPHPRRRQPRAGLPRRLLYSHPGGH